MKKICLVASAIVLLMQGAFAQIKENNTTQKWYVIASAGPSFPIGPYGSTDVSSGDAGLAKTGLGLELQVGGLLTKNLGITGSAIYAKHSIDNKVLNGSNGSIDHWQYWGVLAGLLVSAPIATNVAFDFKATTGVVRVNSPKITSSSNITIIPEDWTTTVPLKLDGNFRFHVARQMQILAGVNYLHMEPKFKLNVAGEQREPRQRMNVLGVNAGIGFSF